MRLTIIPTDGMVSIDDIAYIGLDLSDCGIPFNVHALQWYNIKGWIEFQDDIDPFTPPLQNEIIEELPQWALNCCEVWAQQPKDIIDQ